MRITFKTERATGKWASFHKPEHYIKIDGFVVGMINNTFPYHIRIMKVKKDIMEDGNKNCKWMWITLASQSESIQDAKDYFKTNIKEITDKFTLNYLES